jgi:cupin 2 domain-containing protein
VVFGLVDADGLEVRQVLSGELDEPVDYLQHEDEWALVVSGSACLQVGGDTLDLGPGDWAWLPAGVPHRLLSTRPGTSWVTVHHGPEGRRQ